MYSHLAARNYYGLSDEVPVVTPPESSNTVAQTVANPPVPQRPWGAYPRRYSPRKRSMQPQAQTSSAVGGGQFYDHQMALAAQQNAQMQQVAQTAAPEPSGIGGISWPVIALAGGGFLMLMMVMMSGKK